MGKLREATLKYSYNDVMVEPAILSTIEHRAECNPFDENGMLPLFTAPMDSVVNLKNFELFEKNGIIPILPRTENIEDRKSFALKGKWAAFSLDEFEYWFTGKIILSATSNSVITALIDIANGHVAKLYNVVRRAKSVYGDRIIIMVGNIANPETYRVCVESKVDYVRCSIGTGAGCITCSNTSIGYPIASLISEIKEIKDELVERGASKSSLTKIIADGGIRNYSDIIKALALGADYVMVGSVFSRMLESAAVKVMERGNTKKLRLRFPIERYTDICYKDECWYARYNDAFIKEMSEKGREIKNNEERPIGGIYAKFYGMASKAGQIAMKGKKVHTSEGIEKTLPVTYTMATWVENFADYLRSAMSYTNSRTLNELREANVVLVSQNTYNSVNK